MMAENGDSHQMMYITRNTTISIGLGLALSSVLFFGGKQIGRMETQQRSHQKLEMHEGAKDMFMPRTEINIMFENQNEKLETIEKQQIEILLRLPPKK